VRARQYETRVVSRRLYAMKSHKYITGKRRARDRSAENRGRRPVKLARRARADVRHRCYCRAGGVTFRISFVRFPRVVESNRPRPAVVHTDGPRTVSIVVRARNDAI